MIEFREVEGERFRLDRADVAAGELAAFVAPSLACVREFADVMLGLARPRSGIVRVFGRVPEPSNSGLPAHFSAKLGFAALPDGLLAHLALWENITLGCSYHRRVDRDGIETRLRSLLKLSGWAEEEARRAFARMPEEATPFERASAAWLRALLNEPDLLVCEDLLGGLEPDERRRLIEASVAFQSESPLRSSVFLLVGERLLEELQPTAVFYLSRRGDFRAESVS